MRRRFFSLLASIILVSEGTARADSITATPDKNDPAMQPLKHERRNGIVFGAQGGFALAGASGYPNNARLIGNPDYYSESPLLAGWSMSYMLQGAFTDYLSFGPILNIATFESDQWKSTGWALGFRGDVYPLVRLVPALADTAVYAQLGFGTTELRAKGPYPTADGSQSFFGGGIHHEIRLFRLLGGHAAAGPFAEYNAIRTDPAERHWFSAGLRLAWYGGSVALDAR